MTPAIICSCGTEHNALAPLTYRGIQTWPDDPALALAFFDCSCTSTRAVPIQALYHSDEVHL